MKIATEKYLDSSEYIDWKHPLIAAKAAELAEGCLNDEAIAKQCFEFVRDAIKHSWDYRMNPVTCKASDVLTHGTGYCYAKSHLLAALLRANGIPAGLCYQRLTIENDSPPFCLHGLNAVYLERYGWYRIDARGNKPGVAAEFCPPKECVRNNFSNLLPLLMERVGVRRIKCSSCFMPVPKEKPAFPIINALEKDFPEICAEPLPQVINALTQCKTVEEVFENLPDAEVINILPRKLGLTGGRGYLCCILSLPLLVNKMSYTSRKKILAGKFF